MKRKTHEQFISEMRNINPSIMVIGEYKNGNTPIECECLKCGYRWSPRPSNLLSGTGCPKCASKANGVSRRKTQEQFEAEVHSHNPHIRITGQYRGAHKSITAECAICSYSWTAEAHCLARGTGCPRCSKKERKTTERFVEELQTLLPDVVIVGCYVNVSTPIECKCKKCGHRWSAVPNSLLSGHGCPSCKAIRTGDLKRKSHEQFIKELASINARIVVLGKYKSSDTPIECRCTECEYIWSPRPNDLLNGGGCPNCNHSSTSFMEQFLLLSLRRAFGDGAVLSRNRTAIGKELDIYVPDANLAMEPGSWFWHKDKLSDDSIKRDLCNERGIRLITIYDNCPLDKAPFISDCFVFKQDLRAEASHASLKEIVRYILRECQIECEFKNEDWRSITSESYEKSTRKDERSFVEELHAINPSISIIGEFRGSSQRIKCRCQECGYEWDAMPSDLLSGCGCRLCSYKKRAHKARKSPEVFSEQVSSSSPTIELLEPYINSKTPLKTKCRVCGHTWQSTPHSLLAGRICPECLKKRKSEAQRKSPEKYEEQLRAINPSIILLQPYERSDKKIWCRCSKCGHEWSVIPTSLLRGHGCPACARRNVH